MKHIVNVTYRDEAPQATEFDNAKAARAFVEEEVMWENTVRAEYAGEITDGTFTTAAIDQAN